MEKENYPLKLEKTRDLADIFEIVKEAVQVVFKRWRSGLMLALTDLGEGPNAWIGGYHILSSNTIVMNSRPLDFIQTRNPALYKPYCFSVLLHEYIHTLGEINEEECRQKTNFICQQLFPSHLVTELAQNMGKFLPLIQQAKYGWQPPTNPALYYVVGFDRSSVPYFI